ncbi:unnamed protein product [Plutella xylostella]|uniref:(diamondback moth) hypothetical protein n=1 Tax=Plutella xylostella TaxID=51655 RepID=A0A8S4F2H4_PLUXY|nr:unnamed protein product [Plutella xylostella]
MENIVRKPAHLDSSGKCIQIQNGDMASYHAGIFAVQTKLAERHVYRAYSHTYKNDTYFDYLGIQLPTPDYLEAPNVDPTISSKFNEVQKGNISEIKTKWVRPWYLVPRPRPASSPSPARTPLSRHRPAKPAQSVGAKPYSRLLHARSCAASEI